MVWNYEVDHDSEDGYTWRKVGTDYKVGSRQELLFWRVIDAASGASSKDYFYSPREYEAFSGNTIDPHQVETWNEQHNTAVVHAVNASRVTEQRIESTTS